MARQFILVTEWRLDAPIDRVWALIEDVEAWPKWWPSVTRVNVVRHGDARGVGTVRRLSWQTALPYTLTFETETVRIERASLIQARASGELEGTGLWTLRSEGSGTLVRYDWRVDVTKAWMRLLAPILRPVFAWNHNVVMERGRIGLTRHLTQQRLSAA